MALALVAACSGGEGAAGTQPRAAAPSGGGAAGESGPYTFTAAPVVPGQPAPTYNMVALSGTLATSGRCVTLTANGKRYALVFREGSARFAEDGGLLVDGRAYSPGAMVMIGGSGGSAVGSMPIADVRSACGADEVWTVVPGSMRPRG